MIDNERLTFMEQQMPDLVGNGESLAPRAGAGVHADDRASIVAKDEARFPSFKMMTCDLGTFAAGNALNRHRRLNDVVLLQETPGFRFLRAHHGTLPSEPATSWATAPLTKSCVVPGVSARCSPISSSE